MVSNFEFQPSKRKGRNRYIGKWTEIPSKAISLQFSDESVRQLLAWGAAPETSSYTHQDIAHWCGALSQAARTAFDARGKQTVSGRARKIAEDVEAQWGLFLVNTYSFEELKGIDHGTVLLPVEWFRRWGAEPSAAEMER